MAVGLLAACAFVGLAGIKLTAQGLYYDEIHQAPAAFAYLGKKAQFFAMGFVTGKPLMTMTYSGAIKPALYGLFSVSPGPHSPWKVGVGWGSRSVAVTFPLFSVLARRRLSIVGLFTFFALLVTDATVVLATRHDWDQRRWPWPSGYLPRFRLHSEVDGAFKPRIPSTWVLSSDSPSTRS